MLQNTEARSRRKRINTIDSCGPLFQDSSRPSVNTLIRNEEVLCELLKGLKSDLPLKGKQLSYLFLATNTS